MSSDIKTGMNLIKAQRVLDLITTILSETEYRFLLDQGTLLGLYRDGRFIDWDSDIDLAIISDHPTHKIVSELSGVLKTNRINFRSFGQNIFIVVDGIPVGLNIYKRNKKNYEFYFTRVKFNYGIFSRIFYKIRNYSCQFYSDYFFNLQFADRIMPYLLKINFNKIFTTKIQNLFFQEETREVIVPSYFFEKTSYLSFKGNKYPIPLETEQYLKFRYGENWGVPDSNFYFFDDDKSVIIEPSLDP